MYGEQSILDPFFMALYGGTALLTLAAALYLLLRRSNAIAPDVRSSRVLRRWTAAFFLASALSHLWWFVLGTVWLTDDRLVRNLTAIMLDHLTLVPLVLAVLLAMLQDRRRPLWPWFAATAPVVVIAVWGLAVRYALVEWVMGAWVMVLAVSFFTFLAVSVRQYGRWLRHHYADLAHKEVWQSLVLMGLVAFFYAFYGLNQGAIASEYLAQIDTIVVIVLLLWRMETLQDIDNPSPQPLPADDTTAVARLLRERCEDSGLYLRPGVTLSDLPAAVGISGGALGEWFVQHGDRNFYGYIHRLRIDHFVSLYTEAVGAGHASAANADGHVTVVSLARECGYRSYAAFTTAFRRRMGRSLTEWKRSQTKNNNI